MTERNSAEDRSRFRFGRISFAAPTLALLLVITALTLGASYAIKRSCLILPWGGESRLEYAYLCYNDLQPLYGVRNLHQKLFPYVVEKSYEYPVVIGVEMWVASLFSDDHVSFFHANMPALALCALLAVLGLIGAIGARREVFWFAAGSPLLLYAFHNWDLLAVAPLCLAAWAWARPAKSQWAGAALGVGASAKLFPAFVFPSLWLAKFRDGGFRAALPLTLGAAVAYLACNLPILIACYLRDGNIQGWLGVWQFHSRRTPDFGTPWYWLALLFADRPAIPVLAFGAFCFGVIGFLRARVRPRVLIAAAGAALLGVLAHAYVMFSPGLQDGPISPEFRVLVDQVSFLSFAGGTAALLAFQWRERRPPWAMGGAIVALFLLVSKVHSPQYALWILPFFVLVETPAWLIGAYFVFDFLLVWTSFYWFVTSPALQTNSWQLGFAATTFLRAAALVVLIAWYALVASDRRPTHLSSTGRSGSRS